MANDGRDIPETTRATERETTSTIDTDIPVDAITTWGATRSQLEAILEGMSEGLVVLDAANRKVLYLNETARNLLGFVKGEGKHSVDWYAERLPLTRLDGSLSPLDDYPMTRILRGESFSGLELRFARDGGPPWTGLFGGTLVKDSVVLGVLTLQDVSARVEAEERFRVAFNASPTPTSLIRIKDGRFVDVNERFCELTGFERDELLSNAPSELNLHVETEKRNLALRSGEGSLPTLERTLRRKDGIELKVSTTGEVITIDGEPHLLDTFIDLTEQRQTEEELLQAIEEVMRDTNWFSRGVVEKLTNLRAQTRNQEPPVELEEFTPRERQVLGAMARGQTNEQIAEALGISPNTVRNYVAGVYAKLRVSSRTDAVVWARERGIVD